MDSGQFVDPRTRSKRGRGRGRDRARGKARDRGRGRGGVRSTAAVVEGESSAHTTHKTSDELDSNWDRFESFETQRLQARRNGATAETTEENFIPRAPGFSDDSPYGGYQDDGHGEEDEDGGEDNADYSVSAHNRVDQFGADAPSESFLMGMDDSGVAAFASRAPLQAQFQEVAKVIAEAPLWARLGVHAQWSLQQEGQRIEDLLPPFEECDTDIASTSTKHCVESAKVDEDVEDMLRDVDALIVADDSSDSATQPDQQDKALLEENGAQARGGMDDISDDSFDKWLDEV